MLLFVRTQIVTSSPRSRRFNSSPDALDRSVDFVPIAEPLVRAPIEERMKIEVGKVAHRADFLDIFATATRAHTTSIAGPTCPSSAT